jgi:hypothetical protein
MKGALLFYIIFLLPFSAWAMTPVSDSELSDVTGQAGVNINPDLTMDINIGTIAWGDADGLGTDNIWGEKTTGGYVGVTNFNITNLQIKLRDNDGYNGYNSLMMKPITIDVATVGSSALDVYTTPSACPAPSGGILTESIPPNTTFVRIGLGALKISTDQMQFAVALGPYGDTSTGDTPVLKQVLGVATLGPMDVYVNPQSYVDVYSPNASHGVVFAVNVTLDHVSIPYMSWGGH